MSTSEITVRCYTPEDSSRCRTMVSQGRMEAYIPMIKETHARFFKIAVVLLVPIIAVAVKWSMWTLLILYLAAYLLMSMIASVYIYRMLLNQINVDCLQSDFLDIEKYYSGDSCMFVAEYGGKVIGMVGVVKKEHHKPGVAELQRMSVCSSARRKGIGKLLVNKVVEYCKEKKYDKIILHTPSVQHAAVALYKKCGFRFVKSEQLTYLIFNLKVFHFEKNLRIAVMMVMSTSEITVRCYTPEDSSRCRTMFTQGLMEAYIPMLKAAHARFFKIAVVLLVPIIAVAVKWSMWTLLILYLAAYLLMSMIASVHIYRIMINQINDYLQSDLLDIEKYYSGDSCMFVAEYGGRVIGMVGVVKKEHHKPGVAQLQRMSVCSSARRKGIGKLLVNKVVEYCKEKNYDKIILRTKSFRHAAVALYNKCGFKFVKSEQLTYLIFNLKVFHFEKNLRIGEWVTI